MVDGNVYEELGLIQDRLHHYVLTEPHSAYSHGIEEVFDYGVDQVVVLFED